MAQYWVYLNSAVAGPYEVEQMIRLRGFSRQTLVCIDDASGKPTRWISPSEIPELAHIFKAVDDQMAMAPAAPAPKSPTKALPIRPVVKSVPLVPTASLRARRSSYAWLWWTLSVALVAVALWIGAQDARRKAQVQEQAVAKSLVQNARLPASSLYSTFGQYLDEKGLKPRWEFDRTQDALYHVMVSWATREGASVYAFETNVQAQTVRSLNTAATRLLNDGFPAASSAKSKTAPIKKKSPAELFPEAMESFRQALESADFQVVWNTFSPRKKSEMARGGMSRDGFIRLQSLTRHVDQPVRQSLIKTKPESDKSMLVLMKQAQSGRPELFVKQFWTFD